MRVFGLCVGEQQASEVRTEQWGALGGVCPLPRSLGHIRIVFAGDSISSTL